MKEYSFDDVCLKATNKSSFLNKKVDHKTIKCLSTKISTVDFCRKEKDNYDEVLTRELSRGIIFEKQESVICEFVDSVNVSVSCESGLVKNDCLFSKKSCLNLKKYYAEDLVLFHHSNPTGKEVNCHFVKNEFFQKDLL